MAAEKRQVVVIGSGPTGAMAATVLIRRGIPVTLLESGQSLPRGWLVRVGGRTFYRRLPQFGAPQQYTSTAESNAIWKDRLIPGGMSNFWSGTVPRFAPEDFYEGERLHEQYRWPLTYEDLLPYYEQIEKILEISGSPQAVPNLPASQVTYRRTLPAQWQAVARHADKVGRGFTVVPSATGSPWLILRRGTFFNSFNKLVQNLLRSPHFSLFLGAHALRLEWDGARKKVTGVIYIDRTTGVERRLAAEAVVVAAGPLASTRLLLHSTSPDFPDGLGNTEGLLGRYLHDHVEQWANLELSRAVTRLDPAAYMTRVEYRRSEPLMAASCTLGFGSSKPIDRLLARTPIKGKTFGLVLFASMIPSPSNYVRLDSTLKDRFGQSQLNFHVCRSDDSFRALASTQEDLLRILEAAGYHATIRGLITKQPGASVHYGGTVRMHASPRYGILNGCNRMHAVTNVAVVDASSFTTGPEKNPVPTAMALSARAADRLAEDLRRS